MTQSGDRSFPGRGIGAARRRTKSMHACRAHRRDELEPGINKRRVDSSVLRLVAFALGTWRGSAVVCRVSGWWHGKEEAGRLKLIPIIGHGYMKQIGRAHV